MDKIRLEKLVERLKKEQVRDPPFFGYSRDIFHKGEPCYFCGSTENHSKVDGRYIHSPLALMAEGDESITDEQIMAAAILFCGKCQEKIEEMNVMEMDFE